MSKYKIEGMKELESTVKKLGKLPQACVTTAAKKGANIALKAAKKEAPEDEGNLKRGIIVRGEKRTKAGKKVYDIRMDPSMSDIFIKEHKATGNHSAVRNGNAKAGDQVRSYYPASQEFGYMTKDGGYMPGAHYMRNSLEDNKDAIEKTIVEVLGKEIDKLK